MNIDSLLAVSPIDGRYSNKCSELQEIFSEFGLIKRRVLVECTWLKALAADPKIRECKLTAAQAKAVDKVAAEFSLADAQRVKDIEKTTNHDVKAVEYFLKEKLSAAFNLQASNVKRPTSDVPTPPHPRNRPPLPRECRTHQGVSSDDCGDGLPTGGVRTRHVQD